MNDNLFYKDAILSTAVERILRQTNPWWESKPMVLLPKYRRWVFDTLLQRLNSRLAPIVVLRGPRQVGKTTLQNQIIEHLIENEKIAPQRILRVQFDELPSLRVSKEPILDIASWFEKKQLGCSFNETARAEKPAYLFLDEVQNLDDWSSQVKFLVDQNSVRVFITGSSALRIQAGRDSLAGRIAQIDLGTLQLREIAGLRFGKIVEPFLKPNGPEPIGMKEFWTDALEYGERFTDIRDIAFTAFSERGGYPMAQANPAEPWSLVSDQLNETVIQRAIRHDLRMGKKGQKRDEQLLEEVFRLACRYAGQAPGQAIYVQEIQSALRGNVGWNRILSYLKFLDGALLIKLIEPLEIRLKKKKGTPKVCLCDHGLRASWLQESIPLTPLGLQQSPHLSDLAGHIAESVVGYYFGTIPGLNINHFPERSAEPEVDFVLTIGEYRIPLEVKYRQKIDGHGDTVGLRAFLEKSVYNAPFGILVTLQKYTGTLDPRIVAIPLSTLLMLR